MNVAINAIGQPLDRIDGRLKVTGGAKYTYEHALERVAYAFPVQSTIAKGRIVAIDAASARAVPGVVTVVSHENAPRLGPVPASQPLIQWDADLAVFQSDAVAYHGQFVAAVAPPGNRGVWLERIVVLGRRRVGVVDLHGGRGERRVDVAAHGIGR